jgi:hypothetical protein
MKMPPSGFSTDVERSLQIDEKMQNKANVAFSVLKTAVW